MKFRAGHTELLRPDDLLKRYVNFCLPHLIEAIASRLWLSVFVVGLAAFLGSAAVGLIVGIPIPAVHDEFSYLLAADTFLHGRLTNPTHPMWMHFESIHIFYLPTYMSKYPPAQGGILALGRFLSGYAVVGVWLSMGMMGAAICWMLDAWVPRRWAVIGGIFSVLHPVLGIAGDWAQSYWGGAIAATGGALVIGGARNLLRKIQTRQSFLMGLGLAFLANSRPFEGLLLVITVGVMLFFGFLRKDQIDTALLVRKVIIPLTLASIVVAAWMSYYNYRVTGNIFLMPYENHERQYGALPLFVWQKLVAVPQYRHASIRAIHTGYELSVYNAKRSWTGFVRANAIFLLSYFVLTANIFMLPLVLSFRALSRWMLYSAWAHMALAIYAVVTMGIMLETFTWPHYWAPVVCLNYYFIVQAIRLWRRRDHFIGSLVVPALFWLSAFSVVVVISQRIQERDDALSAQAQRANLLDYLEHQPGKHLVLVNYTPTRSIDQEWVYNNADIDHAKVVWAHDMGQLENCKLVSYFNHHVTWSLEVKRDHAPVKLTMFPRFSCK